MILRLYILISCGWGLLCYPQNYTEPEKIRTFNIVVNYDSYTVKTQMLKENKKVKASEDRTYLWCSGNRIIQTQAGYDGKLIHGYYRSFYYDDNQLRELGTVHYGLKDKEWRFWYADGQLKEVITYKRGKKNGAYRLYNDYGRLMAKGRFKNDQLHGKFYTYNGQAGIAEMKKYRRGTEVRMKVQLLKVKNDSIKSKKQSEKSALSKVPRIKKKKTETKEQENSGAKKQKKAPLTGFKKLFSKKNKSGQDKAKQSAKTRS